MKVAPEQQMMTGTTVLDLEPQPKIPGNGCCCQCCGAAPKEIDVKKIMDSGGKFVQLADGRIVEYHVYGSDTADAKVFLQVTGSMGSARIWKNMPTVVKALETNNIKGIGINVPGHAFSSNHPHRKIVDWAKVDVEAVLKAEGISSDTPLMVEGMSFGAPHAMSIMNHFSSRITHAHLLVPNLPWDVSREMGIEDVKEGMSCKPDYAQKCFLIPGNCCSPCMFCCCTCCFACCGAAKQAVKENEKYDAEIGFPFTKVQAEDITYARAASIHGFFYNALLPQLYASWGFHPFKDTPEEHIAKMKILISYAREDKSSPTAQGEEIAKFFSQKCNKGGEENGSGNDKGGRCIVNLKDGGHSAYQVELGKAQLIEQLIKM
eukprot:TRINITY_DN38082_c1_g1_i1.p1 TRINITY_DN38082_c1_g1~~TRINITY_DN38082_c1_g1_i1.p1  ORF type:complete len:376 (-),score=74.80 TRINITY_DN38082_c1_g1_i1:322-1449(-)